MRIPYLSVSRSGFRNGYILLVRKIGNALVSYQLLRSLGKIVRIDGTGLQVRYLLVGDVDYLVPQSPPGDIRITDNVALMVSPSTVYRDLRGKVDVRLEPAGRADTGAWLLISSTTSPILLTLSSAFSTRLSSFPYLL